MDIPPRHNDALVAHLAAYARIASAGVNRNGTVLSDEVLERLQTATFNTQYLGIFPDTMYDAGSFSFEIATEEPPEEAAPKSEELDNFLKEFALKEVC